MTTLKEFVVVRRKPAAVPARYRSGSGQPSGFGAVHYPGHGGFRKVLKEVRIKTPRMP